MHASDQFLSKCEPSRGVQEVIDEWKWILVFPGDLVEHPEVYTQ